MLQFSKNTCAVPCFDDGNEGRRCVEETDPCQADHVQLLPPAAGARTGAAKGHPPVEDQRVEDNQEEPEQGLLRGGRKNITYSYR